MMSMFFRAFKEEDINAMLEDGSLVDSYGERCVDRMCPEDLWDVIRSVLDKYEIDFFEGAYCSEEDMGYILQSPEYIKKTYESYTALGLTENDLTDKLEKLDDHEIYRLNTIQEFPEEFVYGLEAFLEFYKKARDNNWGVVYYLG